MVRLGSIRFHAVLAGCFSIVLGVVPPVLGAQHPSPAVKEAIQEMEKAAGKPIKVRLSPVTGLATFVTTNPGQEIPVPAPAFGSAKERALSFLAVHGPAFGLRGAWEYQAIRAHGPDDVGMEHVRVQQVYNGVPVTGGQLTVHLRGSLVVAVHAKTVADLRTVVTTPTVDAADALGSAQQLLEKHFGVTDAVLSKPRLEIFNRGLLEGTQFPTQLAWFIEATRHDLREFIWIDAHMGILLLNFSQLPDGLNRQVYNAFSGPVLPGTLCRNEGGAATGNTDCDLAYDYSGDTYNYFFNEHDRDSYDDAGATLISTVDYCPNAANCPFANAFWNGIQMVYGDGFPAADDVVGHELTHAVTENSASLFYYMQSGALNESYSDIFGETIDLTNTGGNDTDPVRWLLGEDVPGFGAIRDMMDPTTFPFLDPGKVSDPQFFCTTNPLSPFGDNGGVHINSGVPNHAYALMVDGGTYNLITVTGIGLDKAGKIQYRALTQYLTSASDFLDNDNALRQSCTDLIGIDGITAGDCTEVGNALDAVEMASPWPCAPLQAAVPAFCPGGQEPGDLFFDDLENTASGNWVIGTISGVNHWFYPNPNINGPFATSGVQSLWGFNQAVAGNSVIAMTKDVVIPAGGALMQFNHSYGFEDSSGTTFWDGGVLEYSTDGFATLVDAGSLISDGAAYGGPLESSNPLGARQAFVAESYGYTATQLDLSSLAGQSVRFLFRMGTDSLVGALGWFIDDIRIYQCVASQPAISVGPSPLAFGLVQLGSSADRTITVENTAGGSLTGNATPSLTPPYTITSGGSYTLGFGETQDVTATFSPTALGPVAGSIDFTGGGGDSVLVTGTGFDVPAITDPVDGSTLAGAVVDFTWTNNFMPVDEWWLLVGSGPGQADIFSSGSLPGTSTSVTVPDLPINGSQIFVRLFFRSELVASASAHGGTWQSVDFEYTAADLIPKIIDPPPGSVLTTSTVTFMGEHDAATPDLQHFLQVMTQGGALIFSDFMTNHKATVSGLPATGTINVRYWTQFASDWDFKDHTYTMNVPIPAITSPAPPGPLPGSTVTFQLTTNANPVTNWWLLAGSAPGKVNYCNSGLLPGTTTSVTCSNLPVNGSQIFVRLFFNVGTWQKRDYQYTAADLIPKIIDPPPGSELTTFTVIFTGEHDAATPDLQHFLQVMTQGGALIFSDFMTNHKATVSGLPATGTINVRYWTQFASGWDFKDHTYTMNVPIPAIIDPVPDSTLTSLAATFTGEHDAADLQHWLLVGTTPGGSNIHSGEMLNHSATVAPLPATGMIHVRYYTRFASGWEFKDHSYIMDVVLPAITTPVPNPILTSSTVNFQWTANGNPVEQWWLVVGSFLGGSNITGLFQNTCNSLPGTTTSCTVSPLPVNGRLLFVRLFYKVGGVWLFGDFQFTAMTINYSGSYRATGTVSSSTCPQLIPPGTPVNILGTVIHAGGNISFCDSSGLCLTGFLDALYGIGFSIRVTFTAPVGGGCVITETVAWSGGFDPATRNFSANVRDVAVFNSPALCLGLTSCTLLYPVTGTRLSPLQFEELKAAPGTTGIMQLRQRFKMPQAP